MTQNTWIIDTGASCHIINSIRKFRNIKLVHNWNVILPNEEKLTITHIGDVHLNADLILYDALFVPSFQYNLISATKLTKTMSCELVFNSSCCIIQDTMNRKRIGSANVHNGLYLLNLCDIDCTNFAFTVKCNKEELWHYRLGYLSSRRLSVLKMKYLDIDVPTDLVCDICHESKQKKPSFPISTSSTVNVLDLIHVDIWGPTVTAMNGSKYFLTIIDDFSRFTWAITMKNKTEVADIIPNFCAMVKTQFGRSVKVIRSDNEPEFNLLSFYTKNGILHQKSCVETPQQNGLVERKHQHILNVARGLKMQSGLPTTF